MRRGRTHIIKLVLGVVIILGVVYLLFSNPETHNRAKQAIAARFVAHGPKPEPVYIEGKRNSFQFVIHF